MSIIRVFSWHWLHIFRRLGRTRHPSGRFGRNRTTSSEVSRWKDYETIMCAITHKHRVITNGLIPQENRLKCLRMKKHAYFQYVWVFLCSIVLQAVRESFQRRYLYSREFASRTVLIFCKSFSIFILLFPFNLGELKGHDWRHSAFSNMCQNSRVLAFRTVYSQLTLKHWLFQHHLAEASL